MCGVWHGMDVEQARAQLSSDACVVGASPRASRISGSRDGSGLLPPQCGCARGAGRAARLWLPCCSSAEPGTTRADPRLFSVIYPRQQSVLEFIGHQGNV